MESNQIWKVRSKNGTCNNGGETRGVNPIGNLLGGWILRESGGPWSSKQPHIWYLGIGNKFLWGKQGFLSSFLFSALGIVECSVIVTGIWWESRKEEKGSVMESMLTHQPDPYHIPHALTTQHRVLFAHVMCDP